MTKALWVLLLVYAATTWTTLLAQVARPSLCQLQVEAGPCRGAFRRYYFDNSSQQCKMFTFGGCRGNRNRFPTINQCMKTCGNASLSVNPSSSIPGGVLSRGPCSNRYYFSGVVDRIRARYGLRPLFPSRACNYSPGFSPTVYRCFVPPHTGPCRGYFRKFYFDDQTRTCKEFVYGGCHGSPNMFNSERQCLDICGKAPERDSLDVCQLPPETGPCRGFSLKFHYNAISKKCERFIYGGCRGNDNRFDTRGQCETKCDKSRDVCRLPSQTGPCRASLQRYYFNSVSGACEQFTYGGCQGNDNRFDTLLQCQQRCSNVPQFCSLPAETGPCEAIFPRFHYNVTSGMCEEFTYGGCQGNRNRFITKTQCEQRCSPTPQDTCQLPSETGPCRANFPRYFYNNSSGKCEQFIYGGCQGNDNRFISQSECEQRCSNTTTQSQDICQLSSETGPCRASIPRYFYNTASGVCEQFIYGGCGGNGNRFVSQSECERRCSSTGTQNQDICQLQADSGPCKAYFPKYFYNSTSGMCEDFVYGGCQGNDNRFDSQSECEQRCSNATTQSGSNTTTQSGSNPTTQNQDICQLPSGPGPCRANLPRFFYNSASGVCEQFVYGGCQGNDNRFVNQSECEQRCSNTTTQGSSNPTTQSQDICRLPSEIGPCRANVPRFFYNSASGVCEQFVYGGCGGNDNKFVTQLQCEQRCSNATTQNQDVCQLIADSGPCRASLPRYFYNSTSGACENFVYGGCQGNQNRFITQSDCEQRCSNTTTQSEDICQLPSETGPCRANLPRFFYNSSSGNCEQFVYGGCQGNDNRFDTRGQCEQRCSSTSQDICQLPSDSGPCFANFPRYSYDPNSGICERFVYGGCGGNQNRFITQSECEQRCSNTTTQSEDICQLPSETGPCRANLPRFFYNSASGNCEQFVYGGCQGNDNRFVSQSECEQRCSNTTTQSEDICQLPPETGPCRASIPRYFYNSSSGMCEDFVYGGCQGNDNRFITQSDCEQRCSNTTTQSEDICQLPSETGPCRASLPRYFYNNSSGVCEQFVYGGCQGNDNRFVTLLDCEQRCSNTTTQSEDICQLPSETGPCRANLPRFFYNSASGNCEQFVYGGCQGNDNRFITQSDCEQRCSNTTTQSEDICQLPSETGPCRASLPRYFYNNSSGVCEQFVYGGCQGNDNRFVTLLDCEQRCSSTRTQNQDICQLPSDSGPCFAYIPSFSYNANSGNCERFVYGGCGGNQNRFITQSDCEQRCSNTTTQSEDICQLPSETGPCRANLPRFFYNNTSGMCEQFVYGGCQGNDNRFDTQSECEQRCPNTTTQNQDVCQLEADSGPCLASLSRYFYNSTSGMCEDFVYGGCQGNDNRFDTRSACEERCSPSPSPSPAGQPAVPMICQLPAETGPCRAINLNFHYNATSGKCEQFVYGGCQGNDNRFASISECQNVCLGRPLDLCYLSPAAGNCLASIPSFFYNATAQACQNFIYGGCGGTNNRFENESDCQLACENTPPPS